MVRVFVHHILKEYYKQLWYKYTRNECYRICSCISRCNIFCACNMDKSAKSRCTCHTSGDGTEGIEYADMVVKYVSDGSGTLDMIKSAEERLIRLVRDDARTHNR